MQCLSKHRRAKRMPWRTKGGQVKKIFREGKITVPGECVSVVESSVTGLISQLKGIHKMAVFGSKNLSQSFYKHELPYTAAVHHKR